MGLIPNVGRKAFSIRAFIVFVYVALVVMGLTMVVPFLITISNSTTNDFDYTRFRPLPRYLWSSQDRFMKGLVYYFNGFRGWNNQMAAYLPAMPSHWTSWSTIGDDIENIDRLADKYVNMSAEAKVLNRKIAADYSRFCDQYPLSDTTVAVLSPHAVNFMEQLYVQQYESEHPEEVRRMSRKARQEQALKMLGQQWGMPYSSFYNIAFTTESRYPMDFQGWTPPMQDPKYQDFLRLKQAYNAHIYTPGVQKKWLSYLETKHYGYERRSDVFPVLDESPTDLKALWGDFKASYAPASPTVPFALRTAWYAFLASERAAALLSLGPGQTFDIAVYNTHAGTSYSSLQETPFPLPPATGGKLRKLWELYVREFYPLRLTSIDVTPEIERQFQHFLKSEIKYLHIANELLGYNHPSWDEFTLTPTTPEGIDDMAVNRQSVWKNFVKQLPADRRIITSSEIAYQGFIIAKYGSLEAVNAAYGWDLQHIEEAFPPFIAAYAATLANNEFAFTFKPILANYKIIMEYLLLNANAVPVTLWLIVLTVFCTLTINPIAAYSMSRFNLRGQEMIILFMLATMAFPAMVSAIPAYLLMRDLGLLNTFFALVLPGAANGMAIFILKGFFDSLPQELFEAATIDGASEFQIFRIVAMPMVKPILAINALTAFIAAYNGWQWALIICQDKKMWTIAVWMYQASTWWAGMPWVVSAGFIVASIPTFVVFISCQKIILRGIIIPSMK